MARLVKTYPQQKISLQTLKSRGVTGSLAKNQKNEHPVSVFLVSRVFESVFLRRVFAINRDKIRD